MMRAVNGLEQIEGRYFCKDVPIKISQDKMPCHKQLSKYLRNGNERTQKFSFEKSLIIYNNSIFRLFSEL